MSIFEDKRHNNGKYVGQVPVTAVPEDINRHGRVVYAENGRNNIPWPHSVRHVPDPMPGVFPGNPGPEREQLRQELLSGKQKYEASLPKTNVVLPMSFLKNAVKQREGE